MSSNSKFACSLCETSYGSEARLKVHEEEEHTGEMFQCLACTKAVSLFSPTAKPTNTVYKINSYMNLAVWVGVRSQVEIYQFPEIFCLLFVHQKEFFFKDF